MNSTENIQEGYRNGLSKTAVEFKNCKQQTFTLTMCLPACLWTQIAKTPFNYTITAQTLLVKCDDYRFQRFIPQFPASGKKISYRKHDIHHNSSSKYASRCWEKRQWLHVFWDSWTVSWSSNESSRKHENTALKSTMIKQWGLSFSGP